MKRRAVQQSVHILPAITWVLLSSSAYGQPSFVNWETPHISPIALTPSGNILLAVNTPDNRLMVFDVSGGSPVLTAAIPVGLDPVSVRARTETEAWVVNHVSDDVSIVDLPTARVVRTVDAGDEPCDVVFAGSPQRAFVSVSQLNQVRVFDPASLAAPTIINIEGEEPRALAVSADGSRVYAAILESGNATGAVRQQDVSNPTGPYGGQNPPPNSGNVFNPPRTPGLPPAPPVAQIVRRNASGQWLDDNNRNWSSFVTWNLHDHDVAVIDAASLAVTYATGLMTNVMAIGVKPDGSVTVVGTEALNQVRFESNLQAVFLRVRLGSFDPTTPATVSTADLNPHLGTYSTHSVAQSVRDQSIGDPRGIAWHPTNGNGYVAGMGSNNVIVIDGSGARVARIDVGQGPTGLALSSDGARLYVLNKFDGSVSLIDTASNLETARVPFFDPTPQAIKIGRPLLYDTHATSGLGHVACASCHLDGRTDFLAWDLGNPAGQMKTFNETCRTPVCRDWHPMKGPIVTQSFQNIVGVEPFHWRGDRENLAAFSVAFTGLQGADAEPSPTQMQQFTDFVATIHYPSSPNRNIDGTMPNAITVTGGNTGNPNAGLNLYQTLPVLGGGLTCNSCHALPVGTTRQIDDPNLPLAPQPMKIAQLRGLWEKDGWRRNAPNNSKGFGFNHHSEFDTLFALLNAGFNFAPPPNGIQQRRDVEAFLLCFNTDTHAGIGKQVTFDGTNNNDAALIARINTFINLANTNQAALVVKGKQGGVDRGYRFNANTFAPAGLFQSDRAGETISLVNLRAAASAGNELTWTVVPKGTETRIGIDRDEDGFFDRDEITGCGADPTNPLATPIAKGDVDENGARNGGDIAAMVAVVLDPNSATDRQRCAADMNVDTVVDEQDISAFTDCLLTGTCP